MTKTIKKKLILLFAIVIMLCVSVCTALTITKANAASFSGGELNAVYYAGEEINIPSGAFTKNGQTVSASSVVIFPDGSTHSSNKITVNQYGTYKVRYFADGGLEQIVEFVVNTPLYHVEGTGSASYDTYKVKNEVWSYQDGEDRYEEIDGVVARLGVGARLYYNKTVDLRQLSADQPLVTVNVIAQQRGTPDFQRLNIKVTDIYNPDVFVILRIKDKQVEDPDCWSYCYVSINDENVFYRGTTTTAGKYGISNVFSFRGMAGMRGTEVKYENCTSIRGDVLSYYLSHEKNEVFKTDSRNIYTSVCKLSETAANWKGFTTGEVKIEMYAELYNSATADFIVREIAGDKLTSNESVDNTPPKLTVDFGDYTEETIPLGVKGSTYKVFDCLAYDSFEGAKDTEVYVYRNYRSDTKLSVSLDNGVFKTDKTGIYTICYVAKDSFGNQSIKTVDVTVVDQSFPIDVSLADGVKSAKQGEKIKISEISARGGQGKLNIQVTVKHNGEEIAVENGSFTAMKLGEYSVNYRVIDYVGQVKELSYKVNVAHNSAPVLKSDLNKVLEKRYISGYEYPVPEIEMYKFASDGSYSVEKASITIENATVSESRLVPTSTGVLKFIYGLGNVKYEETRPVVSIKNGENLDLNKLFVVNEKVTAGYDSENYAKYEVSEDTSIEFINKLLSEGVAITFNTEAQKNSIGSVNVYLTDTENSEQTVKLSFIKESNKALFSINDGVSTEIPIAFNGNSAKDFKLNFASSSGEVTVSESIFQVLNYYNSEEKFAGFTSNKVFMRVEFESVGENGFSFIVKNVSGQNLRSKTVKDQISPVVVMLSEYQRVNSVGASFKLPKVVAGDVISPYLKSFTVTVVAPDGKHVQANGKTLKNVEVDEYEFTLDQYGKYTITYSAIDIAGQKNSGGVITTYVYDLEPPTVTLMGEYETEGRKGSQIQLANYSITDNFATSVEMEVVVMIKRPNGTMYIEKEGILSLESTGVYTVYVYVFDKAKDSKNTASQGNVGCASYQVTVVE